MPSRLLVGFSIVCCLTFVPAANAQIGQSEISLLGGLVFSTLDGADVSGASRRTALMGCSYKVATQGGGEFQADCEPDGPQISAFDFSGLVGGSVEFGRYGAFVRYEHGFRTIDASDDKDDVKNRAFIIGVMWNPTSR